MVKILQQFIGIPRRIVRQHLKHLSRAELQVLLVGYDQAVSHYSWTVSFAESAIRESTGLTIKEVLTACKRLERKRIISHFWVDDQGKIPIFNFALVQPPRRPMVGDKKLKIITPPLADPRKPGTMIKPLL